MGSLLSVYGCFQYKKQARTSLIADQVGNDAEIGFRSPLINGDNMVSFEKRKPSDSKALGSCVHLFQIIYQVDTILWLLCIIVCNFEISGFINLYVITNTVLVC